MEEKKQLIFVTNNVIQPDEGEKALYAS